MATKKQADDAEKQRVSDHRIATKMARINGTEAPEPLEVLEAEPVVEAVVEETVQETVQPEPEPEPEPVKKAVVKKTKVKKPSRSKK